MRFFHKFCSMNYIFFGLADGIMLSVKRKTKYNRAIEYLDKYSYALDDQQRMAPTISKLNTLAKARARGIAFSPAAYSAMRRKYLIDSKNMEYATDVEGAKLIAKAGFDTNKGMDVIAYLETLPHDKDYLSSHPNPNKRKDNLAQNKKLFIEEWTEVGKYNIYNSEVLDVNQSSDRKSIVISGNSRRLNSDEYYRPETPTQIYARCAYKSYVNGQLAKSIEYFNELFKIDSSNAPAYLYASYASEALYKNLGNLKQSLTTKKIRKSVNLGKKNASFYEKYLIKVIKNY